VSKVDGAQIAAALLRLGKIGRPAEEVLVIEAADRTPHSPAQPRAFVSLAGARPPRPPMRRQCSEESEDAEGPVVERDLLVQEYDSDDEAARPGSLPVRWAPGSTAGRRLMQQRARQCVVCMEEKEHTFVPPHREDSGQLVDGHRFCTDCWQEFLQHSLQRVRSAAPPPLTCPLCRCAVDVPDVWGVEFELPAAWTQASGIEANSPQASTPHGSYAGLWGGRSGEPSSFWADAAPGAAASSSSSAPEVFEEECSPLAYISADRRRASRTSNARWRAISCPVPRWQSGGYLRRLYNALAGPTLVQTAGLRAEF